MLDKGGMKCHNRRILEMYYMFIKLLMSDLISFIKHTKQSSASGPLWSLTEYQKWVMMEMIKDVKNINITEHINLYFKSI